MKEAISGRRIVTQLAWRIRPRDSITIGEIRISEGKYLQIADGSKIRLMSFMRVRVPDLEDDRRLDYSGALRSALQHQRIRGLFEGLQRAAVPFVYTTLVTESRESEKNRSLFEFDLVVGTWADGKEKGLKESVGLLEQRVSVIGATLGVALPGAEVLRLAQTDLGNFVKTLFLPGNRRLAQSGGPSTMSALCDFEGHDPLVGPTSTVPEFYVPNLVESGREGVVLGSIKSVGGELHDFRLESGDLKRHVAILGMTGSGKSTTGFTLVKQVAEIGLPIMILDWHNEYSGVVSRSGGRVLAPGKDRLSINPVESDVGSEPVEHIAMVSDIFSDIYHFTHPQAYMFRNALQKRISETDSEEVPSLLDLVKTIESYPLRSAYDNETKVALLRRLVPLTQGQAGRALGGVGTVSFEDLLQEVVCIELGHLRDTQTRAVVTDVILKMIYERRVARKVDVEHLTLVEEARNIAPARRPEDPPSVGERMISELRKFGEAMVFIAQFPSHVAPEIIKNSGTKIVHRVDWPEDVSIIGDSMGLDQRQREYVTKMKPGEAVVSVGRLQSPVLVQVRADPALGGSRRDLSLDAES